MRVPQRQTSILLILVFGTLFSLSWECYTMNKHTYTDRRDAAVSADHEVPPSQKYIAEFLPKVTQPVTSFECCKIVQTFPRLFKRELDHCVHICYSKELCEDKLYPYSSDDEKAFFYRNRTSGIERRTKNLECKRAMLNNPPQPTAWCQQPQHNQQSERQPQRMNLTNIPIGCSAATGMGGMSGPFDRMILLPAGKLAFCGIPKVGISSWIQFLRFTLGAKDYLSLPHSKIDVKFFLFDLIPTISQNHVLQSDEWTKAVFLRDPAERFLSAYLDKIQNRNNNPYIPANTTFSEFIDLVDVHNVTCTHRMPYSDKGLSWCTDPHWRPQTFSCGLWELLPHFDFIGNMNIADVATKSLLEKVDMWHSYGKHYRKIKEKGEDRGKRSSRCKTAPPEKLGLMDEFEGFQQKVNNTSRRRKTYEDAHKTGSADKMSLYYTEELLEKVKRLYADDYKLWNVLSKSDVGWLSGGEMAALLNPACA